MKVLILSHWFPPTNVIGSARPYALARHLADARHDVSVLSAAHTGFRADFMVDVDGIDVHRVPVSSLTLWLEPSATHRRLKRIMVGVARQFTFPDQYSPLIRSYVRAALDMFKRDGNPDVVVSCALPFSLHVAASQISASTGIPWVADNRDLWAGSPYRRRPVPLEWIDRRYERLLLRRAARVVVVGDRMATELRTRLDRGDDVVVIRNGADTDVLGRTSEPECRSSGPYRFLYTGTLYGGRRDLRPLFKAITAASIPAIVEFVGTEAAPVSQLRAEFPNVRVDLKPRLPKVETKRLQERAHFLLAALGVEAFEDGVLTGKVFEYVETRRPIIAVCNDGSELAGVVIKHHLGVASRSPAVLQNYIEQQIRNGVPRLPPIPEELTRLAQSRRFERLLLETIS